MPDQVFKTIYFPRERTRRGKSARVTISIPTESSDPKFTKQFLAYIQSLSSRDFRLAIQDPFLEDLERQAATGDISFSDTCLHGLLQHYHNCIIVDINSLQTDIQLELPLNYEGSCDVGVTFRESHHQGLHGWYPYVEGFSATYVRDTLLRSGLPPRTVYDPFGGAGTTQLAASCLGISSFYSEINPFMCFVAETKVKAAAWARNNLETLHRVTAKYLQYMTPKCLDELGAEVDLDAFEAAFPGRDFFEEQHLRHLLAARNLAYTLAEEAIQIQSLLLLACAANAVHSSNMTRRADLRRRRPDEYKTRQVDVSAFISQTVRRMVEDIEYLPVQMAESIKISADCRQIPSEFANSFDMAITSPPYLNGTNYFRNTKIELCLLGFITSEKELSSFCKQAVAAGINNVSRSRANYKIFDSVENVASQLDECAKDRRIPLLVRQYFSDMQEVLSAVYRGLVPGGRFFLDIGDSKFYGVHVPTDRLLAEIAQSVGFVVEHQHVLARRYSRDKSDLVQVELVFQKPVQVSMSMPLTNEVNNLESKINNFGQHLPYKDAPYSSRNWGHNLHSLCSYQGKLKPAIAHWLIREFVPEGGRVLDPLGGVGTIAFEAALMGRVSVSNDKSPLASTIATAKVNPPSLIEAKTALQEIEYHLASIRLNSQDYAAAKFGLNATVADYYHPKTLEEILKARRVFIRDGLKNQTEAFIWASLLHVLHGNRPYALSRISHPITPLHPKGESVYKPLVDKVWQRIERALQPPLPEIFRPGVGYYGDFRDLPNKCQEAFDTIITSPPFLGMRFDRPNWLRLWFCGWDESDFNKTSLSFLDRQQTKSMNCYLEFFKICHDFLKPTGLLILHLGSGKRGEMVSQLKKIALQYFELVADVCENVQALEQHGISDKGLTTTHHLLFFRPSLGNCNSLNNKTSILF